MNRAVKFILYVVCIAAAVGFGLLARNNLRRVRDAQQARVQRLDEASATENTNVSVASASTNTDAAAAENTNTVAAGITNIAGENTNASSGTNAAAVPGVVTAGGSARFYSGMVTYGLLCVAGFLGFAFLLARDVAHFFARKAEEALFNDDGAPLDPEYEQAEELWKDGKHLEAVRALREYLGKHPREQYVALRIAEIYEENLFNPLAAALEYEEVLKKNLPAERWGWAAIHLANLYSGKLNQSEKAIALLRRIDSEFGATVAAKKARERLLQIDPDFVPAATAEAPSAEEDGTPRPVSNLPPGFRPKQ